MLILAGACSVVCELEWICRSHETTQLQYSLVLCSKVEISTSNRFSNLHKCHVTVKYICLFFLLSTTLKA